MKFPSHYEKFPADTNQSLTLKAVLCLSFFRVVADFHVEVGHKFDAKGNTKLLVLDYTVRKTQVRSL
ncbi:unnamed protein product [Sphenostylis stenocarpa]|uniref:Uncharacterized protein n=1 Tax=Sphenostylis stenocarpa TaxID=92480 RepID=A0AA86RW18_9FABA|nr:unnamed protein product [Sphenostylis stenocarpa]